MAAPAVQTGRVSIGLAVYVASLLTCVPALVRSAELGPLHGTATKLRQAEHVVRPQVGSLAGAVRQCANVAASASHADARTVRCVLDTSNGWHASGDAGPVALPHLHVPLVITTSAPHQSVSGVQWLPDHWEPASASPHAGVWQQTLPRTFATESGSVEQLFSRVGGGDDVQWMSEARWPNARLGVGEPATAHGSPLDPTTWATSKAGTDLRAGVIVDNDLPAGVDWTGALATLNVGYRFLTWTREVLWANRTSFR